MNKSLLLLIVTATLSVPGAKAQVSTDTISNAGYGQQVTRKVNTIDKNRMNNKDQATNAIEAIRGRVAGLTVERNNSNALNAVRLRGTTSLTGGNDPLRHHSMVREGLPVLLRLPQCEARRARCASIITVLSAFIMCISA